ncbi:hypothetical protein EG68_11975 [Paragonimus skrjabini miyazakii]|uniref:Uncharacterized protein n=1 Tax=Paragonimus skrjabini miyazakii TaxID=59628 RepID=A0A8S9YHA3_9TREM|nr:hypothetical protein EG68_11975 [Paragonimus skrjabini miyazakii]
MLSGKDDACENMTNKQFGLVRISGENNSFSTPTEIEVDPSASPGTQKRLIWARNQHRALVAELTALFRQSHSVDETQNICSSNSAVSIKKCVGLKFRFDNSEKSASSLPKMYGKSVR